MKLRIALVTVAAFMGVVLFGVTGASATRASAPQATSPAPSPLSVPITGTIGSTPAFTGTFQVHRIVEAPQGGGLLAEGTLKGLLGTRSISRSIKNMPASIGTPTAASTTRTAAAAAAPAVCPILNLVLGPLDLNLLGLVVHLNQVILIITAIPGAGALLGNLLCAVANLLNPGAPFNNLLSQLLAVINQILTKL